MGAGDEVSGESASGGLIPGEHVVPSDIGDPSVEAGRRYCLDCRYELTGSMLGACPECGRAFDPSELSTTTPHQVPLRLRRRVQRSTAVAAVALSIVALALHTIIPIPVAGTDLRLWVWLGLEYGSGPAWISSRQVRLHFWGGRVYQAEALDPATGSVSWELRTSGPRGWLLRVNQPGVARSELIGAFNQMKTEVFCVSLRDAARDRSTTGFEARGTKVDILSAIVSHYGIEVRSEVGGPDQRYVWYFDGASQRMKPRVISHEESGSFAVSWEHQGKALVPMEESLPLSPPDP